MMMKTIIMILVAVVTIAAAAAAPCWSCDCKVVTGILQCAVP